MRKLILGALLILLSTFSFGQIIISGNVNKYDPVNRMPPIKNSVIHATINFEDNGVVFEQGKFSISNDENGDYELKIPNKYAQNIKDLKYYISIKCVNEYGNKIEIINNYKDTNIINFTFYPSTNVDYDIMTGYVSNKTINYQNLAGDELKLYTKHFYTGTALTLAGGAIISISSSVAITNGADTTPGLVIGSLISIVGAVFIIEAPIHIKRAGIILNENGVGIKVKL
jgi:hypothetical protein